MLGNITLAAEPITISGAGFGSLGAILNSGDNTITGPITIGSSSSLGSLTGTLTISGAITDNTNGFALTKVGTGTLALSSANTYSGGTTISNGVLAISNGSALGSGSISVADGAELDLSGDITLSRNISFQGTGVGGNGALRSVSGDNVYSGTATLQANGTSIQVDAGQLTLSGDLTDGSNGYETDKTGAGLLIVTGNLTSSGSLQAVEGELRITGSYASTVTLAGGTISGTGTVGSLDQAFGAVGTVNPGTGGSTTGTFTTTQGGYAVTTGGTLHIDIGGTVPGVTYDQVVNTSPGFVDIVDSTLDVSLVNGFIPTIGDRFEIINNQNNGAVLDPFQGLNQGDTFQQGAVTFQVDYAGGDGNDVTLTVVDVAYVWTGLGGDNNWSTAANWDTNTAPTDGANLLFPSGASQPSNVNDLSGMSFHSIEIDDKNYSISGNAITLTNGISSTYTSGASTFGLDTTLTATETFDVATGGTLDMSGVITVSNFGGGFGVTKTGGGTLEYSGSSANQYNGGTVINAGTLVLAKADDVISSNGSVIVGDNTTGASLQVLGNNQFWVGSDVTVNEGSTFDVGSYLEHISNLNLQGSTVQIDATGVLYTFVGVNTYATTNNVTSSIQGLGALEIDNTLNTFTIADDVDLAVELSISTTIQGQVPPVASP